MPKKNKKITDLWVIPWEDEYRPYVVRGGIVHMRKFTRFGRHSNKGSDDHVWVLEICIRDVVYPWDARRKKEPDKWVILPERYDYGIEQRIQIHNSISYPASMFSIMSDDDKGAFAYHCRDLETLMAFSFVKDYKDDFRFVNVVDKTVIPATIL